MDMYNLSLFLKDITKVLLLILVSFLAIREWFQLYKAYTKYKSKKFK